MCKWKSVLHKCFAWNAGSPHTLLPSLHARCRKAHGFSHGNSCKTHFASQGFIDSGYITCRIFITLPFQYAYGFIQDFTNFPACTVHASDSFHGICTIKEYSSAKRIKLTGGNAVSCIKTFFSVYEGPAQPMDRPRDYYTAPLLIPFYCCHNYKYITNDYMN